MAPQAYDWTCAACSLDWVLRSTGLNPNSNREAVVYEIGYTEQINPWTGLTNVSGPGQALIDVLSGYGQDSSQGWYDFDTICQLVQYDTGMMSGTNWYHWVALRGTQGSNLWIANSAPGYKGVWDILSPYDFNRLGPFNVVMLES